VIRPAGDRFRDRAEAGRLLAQRLEKYEGRGDVLVLALPRGGVPVGLEVARALGAPLDVYLVRKLGLPGQEELAMGAIATGGARVLNEDLVTQLGLTDALIDRVAEREAAELARRERLFRGDRPPPTVRGRVVVLVDDGIATGSTMRAAVEALRAQRPARLVVAVPVSPRQTAEKLSRAVDELVVVTTPQPFHAVGLWYKDFSELRDEDLRRLLEPPAERAISIAPDGVAIEGGLVVPSEPRGVVLFAHGSGSSRFSPRNRAVAGVLHAAGFATLLVDLLTAAEDEADRRTGHLRFDVELLAGRLLAAVEWLASEETTSGLPLGLFGASTGAAGALLAAARRPEAVQAVVSRGGRPDLAGAAALGDVRAPTLLVVGELDEVVLRLNREAMERMVRADVSLEIVEGATHLFEEPGALERVAELARSWFRSRLVS
jgi:putative phosphoribosyl transferase